MTRPHISIGTLLMVVGVLAVDLVIWRDQCYTLLPPVDSTEPFIWVVIPILSALVVGGLSLARQVIRRGEGHPFLLGFEITGGSVVLAMVVLHWAWGRQVDALLRTTKDAIDHLLRGAGLIRTMGDYYTPFWHDFATPVLVCGLITTPPLLLSILGAWMFQRYEVIVMRTLLRSAEDAA